MSLIAIKYVSEMPMMQTPHNSNFAVFLRLGHGVSRTMTARMTNINTVASAKRTLITPMALVSCAYSFFVKVGTVANPVLERKTNSVPMTRWFFGTKRI